jgi:LysM repeat protein
MIIDNLFDNKKNLNEGLADEFMAMAKAKGYNPRLRGTPDEERARTDAMLKQRAADRANAPAPAPIGDEERAKLQARLKELEAKFDPDFEYSDDHSFWRSQHEISQQINSIKKRLAESKRNKKRDLNEALLMEDPVYRNFKRVGRYIAERKMTEKEILQVFADVEDGMTDKATGANRTFLGRGKDTAADFAGGVKNAFSSVMNSIQSSVPVAAVDVAYDQATDALANVTGGQKGKIMQAIKGYRNLVKEYPKAAGFAKAALVAIAGLATGGAGLPAIAGLTYALDSAIRGDKLSSVIGKGAGAAAVTWGGQKLAGMFSGDAQAATMQDYAQAPTGAPVDGGVYTVQSGDQLGFIAQANGSTTQELIKANPGIDFSKPLQVGQELSLPATTGTGTGSVWQGYQGGVYGDATPGPELLGGPGTGGATSAATTSGSGTLSGVTAQQIYQSPVYQQAYAQEIAKWGASPSAQAIQTAERIATLKAKAAMAGAVRESFDFSKIKLRKLPASELIDQKLTKMAWALNESVGKPQGRSVHLTTQGIYTVFENVHRIAEATATATRIEPTFAPIDEIPDFMPGYVPPTAPTPAPTPAPAPTPKPAPAPAPIPKPAPTTPTGDAAGPGRPQLPDYYRPDMPDAPTQPADPAKKSWFGRGLDALDRGIGAVGGALSTAGRQLTRNVTKEKLKMNWHQGGKPTDSDQLSSWLVSQGVPIGVVNGVYSKMGLPVSAQPQQATQDTTAKTTPTTTTTPTPTTTTTPTPTTTTATDTAKDGSLTDPTGLINPKTNKVYTNQELRDLYADNLKNNPVPVGPIQTPAPTIPAITPTPVTTTTTTTAPAQTTTAASTATGGAPGFNYNNVMQMPGMQKYAKKPAAKPANFAGPSGYGKTTMSVKPMTGVLGTKPAATATATAPAKPRVTAGGPTQAEREKYDQIVANALAKPVAEMLELVTCKEDITRIKRFVDETFVRYNAVDAEAMATRNRLIEHISYQGAVNRRKNAQKEAK